MSKIFSLKHLSLLILIFQTTGLVLTMRYSRITADESNKIYISSTAVVMSELMKFVICYFLVLHKNEWSINATNMELHTEIIIKYKETIKVCVPSFLYTIQNNLLFISLSYLDAATYSVSILFIMPRPQDFLSIYRSHAESHSHNPCPVSTTNGIKSSFMSLLAS